jgi:hypothetical protein
MTTVSIEKKNGKIHVESQYNKMFVERARKLGGKWENQRWVFDERTEKSVRQSLIEAYGTDGTETATVTVRANIKHNASYYDDLTICGRQIARVFGRDSGAKMGVGIAVIEGEITSGGSRKNPAVCVSAGTVIEIMDVPLAATQIDIPDWDIEVLDDKDILKKQIENEIDSHEKAIVALKERLAAL